jgi:hypothetical protein
MILSLGVLEDIPDRVSDRIHISLETVMRVLQCLIEVLLFKEVSRGTFDKCSESVLLSLCLGYISSIL